jgi:NAD(P)H-hydrate epimerase
MKKIDEAAVRDHGLSIPKLMESAGEAVYRELEENYSPLSKRTVGVLCGKGHNGGDGLVAARLLKRAKVSVVAVVLGGEESLTEETLGQIQKAKTARVPILFLAEGGNPQPVQMALEECDLLVDAILGTGLSRPVEGLAKDLIRMAKGLGKPVVAVDIPSGLSADTGNPLGEVLGAQRTVTFGLPKVGFYSPTAPAYLGKWRVDPIGFPPELLNAPLPQT